MTGLISDAPLPTADESIPSEQGGRSGSAWAPSGRVFSLLSIVVVATLIATVQLWMRLGAIQEQLARQSADAGAQSVEARAVAREAMALAQESSARLVLTEARLSEVALQRNQLDELMQSLSRSRDENLVVDIESAIRLAQQQAQLTGSAQPLLAALGTAEQRLIRAAQPRLTPIQRALARDVARIKATTLSDTPALLVKLDELVRMVDDLPLANAVASVQSLAAESTAPADEVAPAWWRQVLGLMGREASKLVRVSRIESPEAVLMTPEQSFFLRENFKLKLLNARLGLLARQLDASRADLGAATVTLSRYFDNESRKVVTAATLLQTIQAQMKTLELPRVDDSLSALTTAAAGR